MSDEKKIQLVKFEGLLRWATIPPRKPRAPSDEYTTDLNRDDLTYSIEVECSEAKFKELKKAGIPRLTELREDEDTGKTYIKLKASSRKTNTKGDAYIFSDPKAYGVDGRPLTENVGNGSKGVVVASLEDVKKGKVLRLKAIHVTSLISFEDNASSDAEINSLLGINTDTIDTITSDVGDF